MRDLAFGGSPGVLRLDMFLLCSLICLTLQQGSVEEVKTWYPTVRLALRLLVMRQDLPHSNLVPGKISSTRALILELVKFNLG